MACYFAFYKVFYTEFCKVCCKACYKACCVACYKGVLKEALYRNTRQRHYTEAPYRFLHRGNGTIQMRYSTRCGGGGGGGGEVKNKNHQTGLVEK